MNDIVGIDLGTTNSLIGIMEAGFSILLADENGARLTPSVVHFPVEAEPLVGAPAARMRAIKPERTVYSIKRFMGLRGDELFDEDVAYRLVRKTNQPLRVKIDNREFSPEEISALILQKLKRDAERALGRSVSRAVITVPAYFHCEPRELAGTLRRAALCIVEISGHRDDRARNRSTQGAFGITF